MIGNIVTAAELLKDQNCDLARRLRRIERSKANPDDEWSFERGTSVEFRKAGEYVVVEIREAPSEAMPKNVYAFAVNDGAVAGFKLHQLYRGSRPLETIKAAVLGDVVHQFGVWWHAGSQPSDHAVLLGAEKPRGEPTIAGLEELDLVRGLFYFGEIESSIPLAQIRLDRRDKRPFIDTLDMNVREYADTPPFQNRVPLPYDHNGTLYDFKPQSDRAELLESANGVLQAVTTMPRSFTHKDRDLLERILRTDISWLELPSLGLHGEPLVKYN